MCWSLVNHLHLFSPDLTPPALLAVYKCFIHLSVYWMLWSSPVWKLKETVLRTSITNVRVQNAADSLCHHVLQVEFTSSLMTLACRGSCYRSPDHHQHCPLPNFISGISLENHLFHHRHAETLFVKLPLSSHCDSYRKCNTTQDKSNMGHKFTRLTFKALEYRFTMSKWQLI